MKQSLKTIAIIIITFGLFYYSQKNYFTIIRDWLNGILNQGIVSYFLSYIIVGFPMVIGLFLIHKPNKILLTLGINKGFGKGLMVSFVFSLPMLIGYWIINTLNSEISINEIFIGVIFAAFFEELYFRGVLFGQIFRYSKLGFIPSILLPAILFASAHLWQSHDFSILIGIFVTTFLGAVFFAWTYIEWDNNLWIPIGLHLFMNLSWTLFSAGDNAFGDVKANIIRAVTIALTIFGTIVYKKRKGLELSIKRNNLWVNYT